MLLASSIQPQVPPAQGDFMRPLLLCLALLSFPSLAFTQYSEPPDVPATKPAADFPLHVHIFGVRWNRVNGTYEGYGRADLLGASPNGFDYTFSCAQPFLHNSGKGEFYQGRWKKENQKLEILTQKIGSDKEHKCELKTSVKQYPYGTYGGTTSPAPAADAKPTAVPPPPQ